MHAREPAQRPRVLLTVPWLRCTHRACLQVSFAGPYPLDGAKVIDMALTRAVARPIRRAMVLPGCRARLGCTLSLSVQQQQLKLGVRNNTKLVKRRAAEL